VTDTTTAPSHDELSEKVITQTLSLVQGLNQAYSELHSNPAQWPRLAATLRRFAVDVDRHGADIATALAAYAEANPTITRPDDGPAVMVLGHRAHRDFWDDACAYLPGTDMRPTAVEYGLAVFAEYGRPELDHRAVPLGQGDAVMVLLALAGDPDAVVQVHVGGLDLDRDEDRTLLDRTLAEAGISTGRPRFWPPLAARFLSVDYTLFDAYGRLVTDDRE
jgi:hypothetical protein